MEALLQKCREGTEPSEEAVKSLCRLFRQAEPEIQPYLKECFLCFVAGAYGAAIVACWCAIARYLRLVMDAVGAEMAAFYYTGEETKNQSFQEAIKRSDKPLYVAYDHMKLVDDHLRDNAKKLDELWKKRCQHAHPRDQKASCQEAFDYVIQASWLLTRRVQDERFQDIGIVLRYAEKSESRLSEEAAGKLVFRVRGERLESLANVLLSNLVSPQRDIPYEKALVLWKSAVALLKPASREGLMKHLSQVLESTDVRESVRPADVAEYLVLWENVNDKGQAIWEYLVEGRLDLSERVKINIRGNAPTLYKEWIDKSPEEPEPWRLTDEHP